MDLSALVVGVIGMVAVCMKVTDFVKSATNGTSTLKSTITQLLVWAAAIGVVFLYSISDFGANIVIGDIAVDNMAGATKVILGLAIGSAAMVANDFRKAFDGSDSAKTPSLNI